MSKIKFVFTLTPFLFLFFFALANAQNQKIIDGLNEAISFANETTGINYQFIERNGVIFIQTKEGSIYLLPKNFCKQK